MRHFPVWGPLGLAVQASQVGVDVAPRPASSAGSFLEWRLSPEFKATHYLGSLGNMT